MATKKYTLYFKGKSKYGHEYDFPIISLPIKEMDAYTSNYKDYCDLFNSLPQEIKDYIKDNLSSGISLDKNADLESNFFVTDLDFNPVMKVIFNDDIDVLYITPKELESLLIEQKMSYAEFQKALMKTNSYSNCKKKYYFFRYVYDNYVKDKKILCMIDDYDVNRAFLNFSYDELMTAAIATDRDNIIVICKKIGQFLQTRRNLAFEFKKIFKIKNLYDLIPNGYIKEDNKNKLNMDDIKEKIIESLNKFKIKYNKEYNR